MIDLTKKENQEKKLERIVEGFGTEKLVVRINSRGVELRTFERQTTRPIVSVTWDRIHRDAIDRELEAARQLLPDSLFSRSKQ